tara:strand:- start:263 stop:1621 length:1359 start_codon:yes stop_codon:yes gene_type:complete
MIIYILNRDILNQDMIDDFGVKNYLKLRIGNKSIFEIFNEAFRDFEIQIINSVDEINNLKIKQLLITSNFIFKDFKLLKNYIKFIIQAHIDLMVGDFNQAFIYYGNISLIKKNKQFNLIYKIPIPLNAIDIGDYEKFKNLVNQNPDSRHFNKLKIKNKVYRKESSEMKKLDSEYLFLKNVPENLSHFYPEVYELKKLKNKYYYEMLAYPYKDFSYQYLSQTITKYDLSNILNLLNEYFSKSVIHDNSIYNKDYDFNFLIEKNKIRYKLIRSNKVLFQKLNQFTLSFFNMTIEDHQKRIENEIIINKDDYINSQRIFSHGDLCFSNILYSKKDNKIILIDPRGFENNGIRSPYYDFAKLSHSILGKYDLIINNKVKLVNTSNLKFELIFDKGFELDDKIFLNFIKKMNLKISLIRLIESSLFLSMLPLHKENLRKCLNLCIRSFEVFNEYKKN